MSNPGNIGTQAELRCLMDFQPGDILAIPAGDAEVVEVIREGESITLVYILRGRRKQLTGVCTKIHNARSREVTTIKQLMNILQMALDALTDANVPQPSEVEMFQGLSPFDWWIHTDVCYYVNVYPLQGLPGLWATVHEYISVNEEDLCENDTSKR